MRFLTTAALALSTLLPAPVWAQATPEQQQPSCVPIDQIAAYLAAEHQEARVQQGIVGEGRAMLVIFASKDGATWSAIMVRPDGLGCMAAAGTDWQVRSDPAPVPETGL